jgi:hypothetical protein
MSPAAYRAKAEALRRDGDALGAEACLVAAKTLEIHAGGAPAHSLDELCKVATGYFMLGDHVAAEAWYRLLLTLDGEMAIAYQNLAAILSERGESAEAQACRERAYAIQRVFVESVAEPSRRLLILCVGGGAGNVAIEPLLSAGRTTRIKYVLDYADADEDSRLPPFDLVFNAIGEPDIAALRELRLEQFTSQCVRPVLNAPAAVVRTQRHRLADSLGRLEGATVPTCIRFDAPPTHLDLVQRLQRSGLACPILVRPEATHGGQGMVLCNSIGAIEDAMQGVAAPLYLTAFQDYRSADGHYRKYRVIFVDRQPFVYHLAISAHWMVHYFSAEMPEHDWKIGEERRFLEDPAAALGERAMAALAAIGRQVDLDYAGIDFTLLADGGVLVFEANATMLVHPERSSGALAYRNPYVERIVSAFEQLLVARSVA